MDVGVARLPLRPARRHQLVEEGPDDLADFGREAPAILRDLLVVAVRSVDLPMHRLDGTEQIGGVEHLRSTTGGRFELRSLGCRMVAMEGAEPVGVKA